jgi:hypothetical protein
MKGIVNMEFSDLVALKLKEILEEKNITLYKLQSLTGVYSSTISQFLIRIQDYKEVSTPFVKEVIDTGIKVA